MIITPTLHCCCRRRAHDGEWRRRRHRHRRRYRQWLRARPPTLCRELGDPRPTPRNHHATPAPARPLGRAASRAQRTRAVRPHRGHIPSFRFTRSARISEATQRRARPPARHGGVAARFERALLWSGFKVPSDLKPSLAFSSPYHGCI